MKLSNNQQLWVEETLEKLKLKMVSVAERNQDKIALYCRKRYF